ncbi:hypothetical protein QYM36_004399 [Artemia franciscana]|uniref:Reverse transcriptase domain-containing protein n=1 Tax=Artemia franciscana TaxID=6661 RepID=A0AA88IET0_ARTSF|nr:hypothetical protein QYM36_004399 [Artemia franciscana]
MGNPLFSLVYLLDPKVVVKVNGEFTKGLEMKKALRQGDPLSPCLFEIYMDPLFKRVESKIKGLPLTNGMNVTALAFMDDGNFVEGNLEEVKQVSLGPQWEKEANLDQKQGHVLLHIFFTFETPEDTQVLKDINLKQSDYEDSLTAFTREAGTSKLIRLPGALDFSERLITKNWKAQIASTPEGFLWNQLYKMKSEEDTKTVCCNYERSIACAICGRFSAILLKLRSALKRKKKYKKLDNKSGDQDDDFLSYRERENKLLDFAQATFSIEEEEEIQKVR